MRARRVGSQWDGEACCLIYVVPMVLAPIVAVVAARRGRKHSDREEDAKP